VAVSGWRDPNPEAGGRALEAAADKRIEMDGRVPAGHVLKLENDAISQTSYNGPLVLAGQNHTIIGAVDLLSPTSNNAAILSVYHYYTDQRQKNYPMWIGAGTHYLYFTNSKQSQSLARYSLHGLMFRVQ
jgi:hypothetical protein